MTDWSVGLEDIRTCPFCGSSADVYAGRGGSIFYVRCSGCGIFSRNHDSKKKAIAAWNMRDEGCEECVNYQPGEDLSEECMTCSRSWNDHYERG